MPVKRTFFITATDTGVGKTVFTALLASHLRARGVRVAALKPLCSGGREDARLLAAALDDSLELDAINPWHFRAAIAPVLAARRQHQPVRLAPVLAHIRAIRSQFDVVLVEGAGGLLAPLGVDFNSRDLIVGLKAIPIIVAPNQLGVVNQILLTLEALPRSLRSTAQTILRDPARPDAATSSNAALLQELSVSNLHRLPWLGANPSPAIARRHPKVNRMLAAVIPDAWDL